MSGKWYVVGKVSGVIATVKTLALLGIGFVGGCMLMEDGVKRGVKNGVRRYGENINEREPYKTTYDQDAYNAGFDAGFNFAKGSYSYEYEMSRAEPCQKSEDEDAEE